MRLFGRRPSEGKYTGRWQHVGASQSFDSLSQANDVSGVVVEGLEQHLALCPRVAAAAARFVAVVVAGQNETEISKNLQRGAQDNINAARQKLGEEIMLVARDASECPMVRADGACGFVPVRPHN